MLVNKSLLSPKKPFDSKVDINRRSDTSVRTAIESIQNLLFDPEASCKIFPLVLQHLAAITDSDFSTILTAEANGTFPDSPESKQKLHSIYNEGGIAFICPTTVSHWVEQKVLPCRPVFFNAPIPKSHRKLLLNPQRIASMIILPVVSQNQLKAVCFLAKKEGNYSGETVRRLMPLLGSVICALQSADSVKGDLFSLNQKISDNRFLSTLLSTSLTATLVVAQDKSVIVSNPAAHRMFFPDSDTTALELLTSSVNQSFTTSIYDFIPKFDDLFKWSNQKARYGEDHPHTGPRIWEDQTACRTDGSKFLVNISVFRYTYGTQRYTTLQIQDTTAIRESAEEYQQASQQLNALTHLVPVGIIRVDTDWNCVYANDKWYEFSGLIDEETQETGWINALHSDDVKRVLEQLREVLQIGSDFQAELRLVSPLGQIRWVDFNTQVLFDDSGAVQGFLATVADITERLVHQERLRHVAEYDGLTGLANRNLFQDRLQQAFYASERDGSTITVFFLDLDGFKDVNDSLGHDAGDKLLQQVAERLLNTLRRNDTVARFGGDEFVILLSTTEKENNVAGVASKVIESIAKPYIVDHHDIYVTASIGIATGSGMDSSPEQILKHADAALYLAKAEGKNNFQLFNDELDKKAKCRIQLANQLRIALQKDKYFLVYQPQALINNQELVGFEALLRFKDDQGTVIAPNDFIPILEETGMIIEVGKWVLEEACKQLRLWQNQGLFPENGFLSINVSPKQLLDEAIISVILNACNKYQVNPQQLVIEITETVIIDMPLKVQRAMSLLKDIGVKLALDDFGTGYSSLTYLQRYPFDHIKIDKSFVANLLTDKNTAKITKAIIALAQSLGLKITAEGVTDPESLNLLKDYGADHYQGYFLGRPAKAEDVLTIDIVANHNHSGNIIINSEDLRNEWGSRYEK